MTELTSLQKQVLELFAKSLLKETFYWTGGTLLSVVYLHHRRSLDLDFFSDAPFSHDQVISFMNGLKKDVGLEFIEEKRIHDRWEFFLHNNDRVRTEFVYYNHPGLKPRGTWNGVTVDSLDDIATNKVMAMFDRNEPKDVFDIYFILTKGGYSPSKLTEFVEKKFGVRLAEGSIWSEAFRKMEELDNLRPLILAEDDASGEKLLGEIKSYFIAQAKKFLDRKLE